VLAWRLEALPLSVGSFFFLLCLPLVDTAALFLTLAPTYYGHEFINPKDLPFAALYLLSLRYIVQMALDFPDLRWSYTLKAGLALGGAPGRR
jgi:hypothetical protein